MHTGSKWDIGSLYAKLLLCLNTMLWRHLRGVDVNLCTFLATAFHVGQFSAALFSYSVPGNVNMSHWLVKLDGYRVVLGRVVMKERPVVLEMQL
jgi:hypothetical protein